MSCSQSFHSRENPIIDHPIVKDDPDQSSQQYPITFSQTVHNNAIDNPHTSQSASRVPPEPVFYDSKLHNRMAIGFVLNQNDQKGDHGHVPIARCAEQLSDGDSNDLTTSDSALPSNSVEYFTPEEAALFEPYGDSPFPWHLRPGTVEDVYEFCRITRGRMGDEFPGNREAFYPPRTSAHAQDLGSYLGEMSEADEAWTAHCEKAFAAAANLACGF
ncbi:hypothetical protein N7457_004435 [Penicillium paradoxum]|uniref:uncharacterized protein n=1 Tax=Penicillium paradoxum TaxID=176176 RepID=UPI002548AC51|nr:uncharacterized protein N7457_004435 [Penicillium paradoxum]KAJ5782661.1 hypothetical protein N7457_004435 [Penicillium paradoxum]